MYGCCNKDRILVEPESCRWQWNSSGSCYMTPGTTKACCREPRTICVANFCILPMTHWWRCWQNFSLSPTRTCYADASPGRDSSSLASSCKTWTEASNSTSKNHVRWRSILANAQDGKGGASEQGSPSQLHVLMARVVKRGKELVLQFIFPTVTLGGGVNCSANRSWLVIQTNMQAESHASQPQQ